MADSKVILRHRKLILPTVLLQALDKGAALFCLAYTLPLGHRPGSDQSFQLIPKTACPRHNQDQRVGILIQNGWLDLIRIGLFSCFPQFTSIGQYSELSQGYYSLSSEPIGNQSGGTLGFSKQQNTLHHPLITTQHKKKHVSVHRVGAQSKAHVHVLASLFLVVPRTPLHDSGVM